MPAYRDDRSIDDDANVWRNIPPWHFVRDQDGGIRASSAAFDNDKNGSPMSVSLADVVLARGGAPQDMIRLLPGFALAAMTAALVRDCNQGIARDPRPDNPAHALVFGRKTKSIQRKLARRATWVIPPSECNAGWRTAEPQ